MFCNVNAEWIGAVLKASAASMLCVARAFSRVDADLDFSGDVFAHLSYCASPQLEIFCCPFLRDLR
jgi:hypothetical protein